jgi:DnaK suppressor protein
VNVARARSLLEAERAEVERLLSELASTALEDRDAERQIGDEVDSADPLAAEGVDDAIVARLQDRLAAIARAEKRLADGTFGRSIRSGAPIPDERLEVMPTAELTVEEASD